MRAKVKQHRVQSRGRQFYIKRVYKTRYISTIVSLLSHAKRHLSRRYYNICGLRFLVLNVTYLNHLFSRTTFHSRFRRKTQMALLEKPSYFTDTAAVTACAAGCAIYKNRTICRPPEIHNRRPLWKCQLQKDAAREIRNKTWKTQMKEQTVLKRWNLSVIKVTAIPMELSARLSKWKVLYREKGKLFIDFLNKNFSYNIYLYFKKVNLLSSSQIGTKTRKENA